MSDKQVENEGKKEMKGQEQEKRQDKKVERQDKQDIWMIQNTRDWNKISR